MNTVPQFAFAGSPITAEPFFCFKGRNPFDVDEDDDHVLHCYHDDHDDYDWFAA